MILLSLDPSSKRTGYAVFDVVGPCRGRLIEAGYFKPDRQTDDPIIRIRAMARDLRETIAETQPVATVIEVSSGKVGRRHTGGGAGLSIYGEAVGYMLCTIDAADTHAMPIKENDWTMGVAKETRQLAVAARHPSYAEHFARDGGGDVADAIGLGEFWILAESPHFLERIAA